MIPVIGLVQVGGQSMADRYSYVPYIGLSIMIAWSLTDLAVAYEAQGKSQKAIELYERILAANPDSVIVRRRLGAIYVGQKRFEDALKQFREIERIDSDPRDARTKIGLIYFEKGDVERAATEFNLVLASDPKNDRVRFYLGVAYAELGETSRALDELDAVSDKSDYYIEARVRRATILQKDDPSRAIKEIEATLAAKPDSPDLMSFLASLYRDQKRYPKAVEILEKVVAKNPDNDRYRFTLGATYDEANDRESVEQIPHARSSSTQRMPRRSTTSVTRTRTWA
jgi:tetratricopeptide (TPR) repeat protein